MRTMGARRTKANSNAWNAAPKTAVSGSDQSQPRYGLPTQDSTANPMTISAASVTNTQCSTLRFEHFFCASCRLMTSNFSLIALRLSASVTSGASPSRVFTGASKASDSLISRSASGTDKPCSHFDTVWRTTLSLTASSSCESPFALRNRGGHGRY